MAELQKVDWKKIVAESDGTRMFLPEKFLKKAEELKKIQSDYNSRVNEMAKIEITLNVETQKMFFELRQFLETNGHTDIWRKEIGFEANAYKDDVMVVNLNDPSKG